MSKKQADQALIERSPGEVVRDFLNLGKVKRLVRVGSDMFSAATPYIEKPTPLNAARAVFMIGKIIVDDLEVWPEDYFDDTWESPWPEDFTRIILKALKGKPLQVIKTSDEAMLIHVHHFRGIKFGYVANKRHEYVPEVYVQLHALEQAKVVINEENGVIVINQDVKIAPVAIAQGSLTVRITETPQVSQPSPFSRRGDTVVVPRTDIQVTESGTGKIAMLSRGASLRDLVNGLNALGVSPRDLIGILQTLKSAGALRADLEVR